MMTFFEHYTGLRTRKEQKLLRQAIIQACQVERATFYSWLDRLDVPDEKNRLIIADILSRPTSELFPQKILK